MNALRSTDAIKLADFAPKRIVARPPNTHWRVIVNDSGAKGTVPRGTLLYDGSSFTAAMNIAKRYVAVHRNFTLEVSDGSGTVDGHYFVWNSNGEIGVERM